MSSPARWTWLAAATAAACAVLAAGARPAACDSEAERIELGRRLFFDPAIGRAGRVSCAACHDPEHGFSDARARSVDETGPLPRHSQPLTDLAGKGFHWDGEFDTVRDVIDARVAPPQQVRLAALTRTVDRMEAAADSGTADREMAQAAAVSLGVSAYYGSAAPAPDPVLTVAARIARDGRYDEGFRAAFGDRVVTSRRVGDALEAFLRSLTFAASPFDDFLAGDKAAISPAAHRGYELFRGKAGCAQCHVADGSRPRFTDGRFHNTGVTARSARGYPAPDPGRVAVSFLHADRESYKTPSLRDVARRAPYFHDASARTLRDAVQYYAAGGTANDGLDERVRRITLTAPEVSDLTTFLESLTGRQRPGLGVPGPGRAARLTVHVEDLAGSPVPGAQVIVSSFGDRLAGTREMPSQVTARTDAAGDAVVRMPLSTHVMAQALGAATPAPVPDWKDSIRLIVGPPDTVALVVRFPPRDRPCPSTLVVSNTVTPASIAAGSLRYSFEKVRDLASSTALYARRAPPAPVTLSAHVSAPEAATEYPDVPVDLAAGCTSWIDLASSSPEVDDATALATREELQRLRRIIGTPRGR